MLVLGESVSGLRASADKSIITKRFLTAGGQQQEPQQHASPAARGAVGPRESQ